MQNHEIILEVKLDGGAETYIAALWACRRRFPASSTTDSLPKTNVLQPAKPIILEPYTDGILPVHGTIIIHIAHYKTSKIMPIRFFMVYSKHKVMISHIASQQTTWPVQSAL